MLTLYNKNETNFNNLGLGVLRDFTSDPLITEQLNSAYTLEFDYSKDGYLSDYLVEENIVKAKGQLFRIWQVKKDMRTIKILAKHIFFDLSKNFIEDSAPSDLTAQGALSWILERTLTPNNFTVNGDCTATASARYVRKTVTDAVFNADNALLKRFGGELEYNNFNVFVHAKRGTESNFSIRYRKNLKGIDFNLDFSTVITRVIPQGNDELLLDELYVDSPNINNYFQPLCGKVEFDIGVDEENEITEEMAKAQLLAAAQQLFVDGIDMPEISIKVDFIELSKCEEYKQYSNLESCNLGDTIQAIIPELNINCSVRVVKTIYNCNLKRFTNLELGTVKPDFVNKQSSVINDINNVVNKINPDSILSQAQDNARILINHPFKGNILIDYDNGNLYLMDTTDPETAVNVWKWSLGGLGFSKTGVNGTYEVAITQNGGINANFITAGKINTNLIEGYDQIEFRIKDAEDDIDDLQDNTYTKEEIQDIADGTGVNGVVISAIKLPNTQGYVDKTGMHFHKDGAPTKSTIDEKGIEVDNTSDNTPALYAGHVDSNDSRFNTSTRSFENKSIVYTHNLVNKGDAVLGNHALIMDYTDESGNAGTGWFAI